MSSGNDVSCQRAVDLQDLLFRRRESHCDWRKVLAFISSGAVIAGTSKSFYQRYAAFWMQICCHPENQSMLQFISFFERSKVERFVEPVKLAVKRTTTTAILWPRVFLFATEELKFIRAIHRSHRNFPDICHAYHHSRTNAYSGRD